MAGTDSAPRTSRVAFPTLAIFSFLAAAVACVTGFSLLFPGPAWMPMWNLNPRGYTSFHALGWIGGAVLFAVAAVCCATGAGLLNRRRWAWWLAVLTFAANGIGDVISLIITGDVLRFGLGVLIAGGFLWLLVLTPVRRSLR